MKSRSGRQTNASGRRGAAKLARVAAPGGNDLSGHHHTGGSATSIIKLKRAYEKPLPADGPRILVERLWPRGLTKKQARIDLWLKDVAPSTELRNWFGHDPERWTEFRNRYQAELKQERDLIALLEKKAHEGPVTFVYAARDEEHNGALVLKEIVERKIRESVKSRAATSAK